MRPLRVLIVDDSAINRRTLAEILGQIDGVTVVGAAGDGDEALRLSATLAPDLITLDLEMPRMDGFTFLRLLMASRPIPVVVVSSHSAKENVFRALELGAIDFVAKPEALLSGQIASVREQLVNMVAIVRQLAPAGVLGRRAMSTPPERGAGHGARKSVEPIVPARLIVIAASTGGPTALLELFARLPDQANTSVVVAQHMPERFTKAFAERLDRLSPFQVREAEGEIALRPNLALVCPGGKSIEIENTAAGLCAKVVEMATGDRYAPSADRLFRSAARAAGERAIAVVLTGMGDDGAQGAIAIKQARGIVLVESEQTAVVYGMPRAAKETGSVDEVLPLPELIGRVAGLAIGRGRAS